MPTSIIFIMIISHRLISASHRRKKEKDNNRKRVAPSVVTIRSSYEWKWNMNLLDCFFALSFSVCFKNV